MGLFEQFPYTNFHGLNLKWILDRMVEFETRLSTAEDDIDALEGRMDTAEGDIDALEGRMDTAEGDIDALETQMPKSVAGDAGKVLTATGAGTAAWMDASAAGSGTYYLEFEDENAPTPEELVSLVLNGSKNIVCYVIGLSSPYQGYHYAHLYGLLEDRLYFDSDEQFWGAVGHSTPPAGMKRCQVEYRTINDVPTWHLYNMDGARNERGMYPSEEEIIEAERRAAER